MLAVAEDATLKRLQDFFEHRGRRATVCTTETEARKALAAETFAFVLVDLELDVAVEVCRAVRTLPAAERPHVLVLTPSETVQAMRPVLEAGIDDFLVKPIERTALQLRLAIGDRRLGARNQLEKSLRFREQYFRSLLENSSDLITIVDAEGHILYQSASSENLLGWDAEEMMGWNFLEHLHSDDRQRFSESLENIRETPGATVSIQCRIRHRSGEFRTFEPLLKNLLDDPVVEGIVVTSRNIAEHRRIERELKRERAFFQQLFRNSPSAIAILDEHDRIIDANHSFLELFGYELDGVKRRPINELIVPKELAEEAGTMSREIFERQLVDRETVRRRSDGTSVEVSIIGYPIEISGRLIGAFGIYSDITERKEAARKLYHHAYHDVLTGLPNRSFFSRALNRALEKVHRQPSHRFAVLFLDLDRFKVINDSLGHEAGDELLIEMARRLESCVRPEDTTARLGGDEFTIILDDLKDPDDATRIADRILDKLHQPFQIAGQEIRSSGSIGIAFSSLRYESADELLRDADIAMYRAKGKGRACYAIFDEEMHKTAVFRLQLESQLRRALDEEELVVHYQPMVSLTTRQIVGFEALVRWPHPSRGLIGASEFISVAEESGSIVALGRFVLAEACRQAAVWQARFPTNDCLINVNLSAKEAAHGDFLDHLDRLHKETRVKPASIGLEMNESLMGQVDEGTIEILWELRRRGYRLYIDAFGTGQASLAALHRLPIDALKIDRSFVRQIVDGGDGLEIVRAINALGESLGLRVVAEGVEAREQLDETCKLGVPFAQGYFFGEPVPPEEAERLLRSGIPWSREDGIEAG